jgi:transposase
VVALEACTNATSRTARLVGWAKRSCSIVAADVEPSVERQKNDGAAAEAIGAAAGRSTMRFVAVESETRQAAAMTFEAPRLSAGPTVGPIRLGRFVGTCWR